MKRAKQLNTYALLLIGFMIISMILENGLIAAMYAPIQGLASGTYATTDGLEVTLIECSNGSTNDFCNVQYNSCKIDKVSVTVNDLSLISSNTDVKYLYHIISQASCDATFFSEDNIPGYKISRQVDVYATDVRWRDSNK